MSETLPTDAAITDFRIQNLGLAQSNVPFTFGQVFAVGALSPSDGLTGRLQDGSTLPLQVDVKATHADGSVRHCVISGVLPKLAIAEVKIVALLKGAKQAASSASLGEALKGGVSARILVSVDGVKYPASLAADASMQWLAGPIANEWFCVSQFKDENGNAHPLLTARFGVRTYAGLARQARIECIVENSKTFVSGSNLTYDVQVEMAGKVVYSKNALQHYHHSRWHQYFWLDEDTQPNIDVKTNTEYLVGAKAVPNYDLSIVPTESALAGMVNQLTEKNTGPMTIGPVYSDMGATGGRGDIGPLPQWQVLWLLSNDVRARNVTMAAADGSGSWSMHYRDENTGFPLRTDNERNKNISMHFNMRDMGPLPAPRIDPKDPTRGGTPFNHDTAHEPSLVYLPYLLTGEYYYLEELQFWAAINPLATAAGGHGYGKGLVRWQQLRGQAWSMRTLGHVAYITPDADPLKQYFTQQLDNNLEFYYQAYVAGNPNKLGVYDGSGQDAFQVEKAIAPWQDDFFTWSFGYLSELGFEKAKPIHQWKSKFVLGRMTDPGFCSIMAASYFLWHRKDVNSPVFDTFEQVYKRTFGEDMRSDNDVPVAREIGQRFISLPCGSQEQADLLTSINKTTPDFVWERGRMAGYADSTTGYPAILQMCLATVVDLGADSAKNAWSAFMARKNKPDYRSGPQFALVPRTMANVRATPAKVSPPALMIGSMPDAKLVGEWQKVANENEQAKVGVGSFVRYGVEGKGLVYGMAISDTVPATNDAFGRDPVPQVVKALEVFKERKQMGKITTGTSTKLAKLKDLIVTLFDPSSVSVVKEFDGVDASTKGVLTLSDTSIIKGYTYAATVKNSKGEVLVIHFPLKAK